MKSNVPQPFPYQGSKRKQGPAILQCIPSCVHRLVEPFAGSAAVSVAAAWAGRMKSFWLNDRHSALVGLWRRIIQDPEGLAEDYSKIWRQQQGREPEYYNEVRSEFNRTHQAELLLFLLARCVKAAIRYNRKGEFNNSPDHRRKGMRPETMAQNIRLVSQALGPGTKLTTGDYRDVLRQVKPSDLVYMDPPYQGVCKDRDCRYVKGVDYDEFVFELEKLTAKSIPFIVSYDGRTGENTYGKKLPDHLRLAHAEILVGRSTQATLLGRNHSTYESLYVSAPVLDKLERTPGFLRKTPKPVLLFD